MHILVQLIGSIHYAAYVQHRDCGDVFVLVRRQVIAHAHLSVQINLSGGLTQLVRQWLVLHKLGGILKSPKAIIGDWVDQPSVKR